MSRPPRASDHWRPIADLPESDGGLDEDYLVFFPTHGATWAYREEGLWRDRETRLLSGEPTHFIELGDPRP